MASSEATERLKIVEVMGRRYRQYEVVSSSVPDRSQRRSKDARRGNSSSSSASSPTANTSRSEFMQAEEHREPHGDNADNDDDAEGLEVTTFANGNKREYSLRLPIPAVFHRFIVGKRGETIKRLMAETGAKINVPRPPRDSHGAKSGAAATAAANPPPVVITAASASAVRSAHTRLELVMSGARDKLDYTHFISVPLALDPSVSPRLQAMQNRIFSDRGCAKAEGLDKSIFWRRDQFHLTLVMLKLYSSSEVASVQEIFDDVSRSAAGGPKSSSSELSLSLGGLEIMNDDPAETHVVFVDVEQNAARAKLERVLFTIQERIDAVGLLDRRERQRLFLLDGTFAPKLHATVINTRLRRSGATSTEVSSSGKRQLTPAEMATQGASIAAASGPRSEAGKASANRRSAGLRHEFGERAPVNAGPVLTALRDWKLGQCKVPALHLSQRGAFDASGYYKCVLELPLGNASGAQNAGSSSSGAVEPVFILAGQSNMAGRCLAQFLPSDLRTSTFSGIKFRMAWDNDMNFMDPSARSSSHGWQDLQCQQRPRRSIFGPEMALAASLGERIKKQAVDCNKPIPEQVHFIKFALGSTNMFFNWNPDTPPSSLGSDKKENVRVGFYRYFLEFVTKSFRALQAQRKNVRLAGMFWLQGSNDSSNETHAKNYLQNFTRFASTLRRDLQVSPQQLPIVVAPVEFKWLKKNGRDNEAELVAPDFVDVVNAALQEAGSGKVPHCLCLRACSETVPNEKDRLHGVKSKWPSPGHLKHTAVCDIGRRMGETVPL